MARVFSKWIDESYGTETAYVVGTDIWSFEVPLKLSITTICLFMSNDGDIAIYRNTEKVFPTEDYFSVVGVMVKIDLSDKEEIRFEPKDRLRIWFRNRSGSPVRVIAGLVGYYE